MRAPDVPRNWRRAVSAFRHADRAGEIWRAMRGSAQWPALAAAYVGLSSPRYPFEFVTRHGDVLVLETFHDLVTAWIIFFRPEYPVATDLEVVVDVGANIGAFALYAARRAPRARVVAVEPFPDTAARLREAVARNHLGGRILCRECALAGAEGERTIDASRWVSSQFRSILFPSPSGVPIHCTSLAGLLEGEGLDRVDLMKMDIEGAEHEVLLAAPRDVLRRISALALEYHAAGPKGPLFAHLADAGFLVTRDRARDANRGVAWFERRRSGR